MRCWRVGKMLRVHCRSPMQLSTIWPGFKCVHQIFSWKPVNLRHLSSCLRSDTYPRNDLTTRDFARFICNTYATHASDDESWFKLICIPSNYMLARDASLDGFGAHIEVNQKRPRPIAFGYHLLTRYGAFSNHQKRCLMLLHWRLPHVPIPRATLP